MKLGGCLLIVLLALVSLAPGRAQTASPAESGPASPAAIESEVSDSDDTLAAAQEQMAAARPEPDALRALFTVVNLQRRRGDYADGLAGAHDGFARAKKLGDPRLQIDFLYLLGRIYWNLTDYPRSIEAHLEELKLSRELGDPFVLARTHGGLGLTYHRYGRNAEALHHLELGLAFAKKAPDQRMRSSILNSLGNYHLGERDYPRAAALHTEALRLREESGNARAIAETLTNLGLAADAAGDHATALDHLGRALATFETLKYRRYIANTHRRLARVLRNAGRTDEALAHLRTALQVAGTLESADVLADIYQEYALTHEARADFAAALDYQRRLATVTELVRNESDRRRMDELNARYRQEQRELEIALLRRGQELKAAELQRRRSQNVTLAAVSIGGVTLLGAVVIVQLVRSRSQHRLHLTATRSRERAEAAQRLKTRMLQMASHDLKVPLTALNATAGLITRAPRDEAAVLRLARGIQADTARMRGLVRDFLDASAIEDGNLQLHTAELDLLRIAGEAVESLQPVAGQKGQRLALLPPAAAALPVLADAERLRQVFDNLIGNALKFTPPAGDVTVALGEAGAWAFAEVRDSGPGLGPADFARIFGPYQRLSAQPTGDGEDSTGLGLFITRELLALQGGRLEVQSQPGRGAVFRVLLPVPARVETK